MPPLKYQLVFSLVSHPILGVMIEPYVVQELTNGRLSLTYQKVGKANANSFIPDLGPHENQLFAILQSYGPTHWAKELQIPLNQAETHLVKIAQATDLKNKLKIEAIRRQLAQTKKRFFSSLDGSENLYETGTDGYPAFRKLVLKSKSPIIFQYLFGDEGLVVRPVITGVELGKDHLQVLDPEIPYILAGDQILHLPDDIKPTRFKPFLQKKEMQIAPKFVDEFCRKFIVPDLRMGIAQLSGQVHLETLANPKPLLHFRFHFVGVQVELFEQREKNQVSLPETMEAEIYFLYGDKRVKAADESNSCNFNSGSNPEFQLITRNFALETELAKPLYEVIGKPDKFGVFKIPFSQFKGVILPKLKEWKSLFELEFSPEFAQLVLKLPKVNISFQEKIDYFQLDGSIDWGDFSLDLNSIKNQYQVRNGWLQIGSSFYPLEDQDEKFLNQLVFLASDAPDWRISKKTALAIRSSEPEEFSTSWNRLLAMLGPEPEGEKEVPKLNPEIQLREYQKKGLDWMVKLWSYRLGGLLADDMGLGKTIQAGCFLLVQQNRQPNSLPALIVMPSSLIFNWKFELNRLSKYFKIYTHSGAGRMKNLELIFPQVNVILVSFQTLARDISSFGKVAFSTIIVDEAHHLKNRQTVAYQSLQSLKKEQIFLLTGTPIQNSMVDLWALSELCNPGFLSQKLKPQALAKIESNQQLLNKMAVLQSIFKPLMMRRTKENVLSELPEKAIVPVYCTMTEDQEKIYLAHWKSIVEDIQQSGIAGQKTGNMQILKGLTQLRQLACHPRLLDEDDQAGSGKFDLIVEKLEEVLAEGHKVLIFSSYVRHLQIFRHYLENKEIHFSWLTGETREREREVHAFRHEKDRQVFFISLKAGGVGLNLVEASYVFLLDPWWNPAAENQAIDRAYRIGQTKAITVYKFITSGTVEEKIVQLQERKQVLADQWFGTDETEPGHFSIDMLQEILVSNS